VLNSSALALPRMQARRSTPRAERGPVPAGWRIAEMAGGEVEPDTGSCIGSTVGARVRAYVQCTAAASAATSTVIARFDSLAWESLDGVVSIHRSIVFFDTSTYRERR